MKTKETKIISLLASVCAAVLLVVGCDNSSEINGGDGRNAQSLIGTHWKLIGFVDAETEVLKKVDPKDERYYTITFNADSSLTCISSIAYYNTWSYRIDSSALCIDMPAMMYPRRRSDIKPNDSGLYVRCISGATSYIISGNQLRLYYNWDYNDGKEDYLLFEKRDELAPLQSLFPLDWSNYNDVYTINWHYRCSTESEYDGKSIKVVGWIVRPEIRELDPNRFHLTDDSAQLPMSNLGSISIKAETPEVAERLKVKFERSDLMKECYNVSFV